MRAFEVEVETLTKPAGNWREYKTSHEFWGQKSFLLDFFGPAFIFCVYIHIYIHICTCCCCLVTKSCPILLWPHGLQPSRLLCPWDFPGKNTRGKVLPFPSPGHLSEPGVEVMSSALQVDSLPWSHLGSPWHREGAHKSVSLEWYVGFCLLCSWNHCSSGWLSVDSSVLWLIL